MSKLLKWNSIHFSHWQLIIFRKIISMLSIENTSYIFVYKWKVKIDFSPEIKSILFLPNLKYGPRMHWIGTDDNFWKSHVRVSLFLVNLSRVAWVADRRWNDIFTSKNKTPFFRVYRSNSDHNLTCFYVNSRFLTRVLTSKYWMRFVHSLIHLHYWKFHLNSKNRKNYHISELTLFLIK